MDKREAYKRYKLGNLATEYFNVTSALHSLRVLGALSLSTPFQKLKWPCNYTSRFQDKYMKITP